MAAGSPRRPRSPAPDKVSSPPVSELSTSDVATGDGSGSIRDYDMSATPVTVAALSTLTNDENNSDSAVSDASSVVEEDEDEYSDSGSDRSASDTYYLDMGGEAVRDELGWQDVVKQHDIYRTYGSDEEDGGACPDIIIFDEDTTLPELEDEIIEIEPTPVVHVDIEDEVTSPVEILDEANVDVLLDDDDIDVGKARRVDSDSDSLPDDVHVEKTQSVDSLPVDVNVNRRGRVETLLAGEDIDDDSENEVFVSRKKPDLLPSASTSASASDDSVVAVDLSDGEEVLADDSQDEIPSWAQGAQDLTPADLHKALAKTAKPETDTLQRKKTEKKKVNCERRRYLLERLRTVRTALQMVQIETAAKSAEAQLNVGAKGDGGGHPSEQKMKYKKELAALSATLDFLAKMALQRAIEVENREEAKTKDFDC